MKNILNKEKGKFIFIAVIVIIILLLLISTKLLKSYKSLDKYDDSVIYNSKIVASSGKYAIGLNSNSGVITRDILAKTDNGKWKPLRVQEGYDVKTFWIVDNNNRTLSVFFEVYYIKESNISIIYVFDSRGLDDLHDKLFDQITEIKDNRDSVFHEYEFIDDNETYTFTAFIEDFNVKEYILYINGKAYPYTTWN